MPRYPSDLTDEQWAVLEPRAREVMRELVIAVGRPMVHDLRAMCDAVAYVVKNGIEWRALPVDFPPWEAVYAFYERWNNRGLPQELVRAAAGAAARRTRAAPPSRRRASWTPRSSSAPIPSPRPPAATTAGRRSPAAAGTWPSTAEGWLLALVVTAASVSDKAGAKLLVIRLFDAFSTLKIMWADSGYDGAPLARWVKTAAAITLKSSSAPAPHSFQVVRRRWVVERTFGWLMRYRRLVRDYERRTDHARGHDLLGHRHHHDQAARPLRDRQAARTALGRKPPATGRRAAGSGMTPLSTGS